MGLGYKPTPKSRGWLLSLEEADPSPKPVVTLEDGIRAVELEDDLESALDMLSDGHGNRVHPVQAEEDFWVAKNLLSPSQRVISSCRESSLLSPKSRRRQKSSNKRFGRYWQKEIQTSLSNSV